MYKENHEEFFIKILEKIKSDLKEIEGSSSMVEIKEKIHELMDFMNCETPDNRSVLEDMIYSRLLETRGVNPELNTYLYILYRNFTQNKISMQEAERLYIQYSKELSPAKNI